MPQFVSALKNSLISIDHNSIVLRAFCAAAIIYWLQFLVRAQSFFIAYLVTGVIAIGLLCRGGGQNRVSFKKNVVLAFLTVFLAALTILGNYSLITGFAIQGHLIRYLTDIMRAILFITSTLVTYGIIAFCGYGFFLDNVIDKRNTQKRALPNLSKAQVRAFYLLTWLFITAVYLTFLFLAFYPGGLTSDSISQVTQIISGEYTNHHPFWHTQVIRLAMTVGFALFGDINAAVATFSVMQCITMAAIFAFSVSTMLQMGAKRWLLILVIGLFVFLPYHWSYASTMWKDVLFGGTVLLFVCCFCRLRKNIGNKAVSVVLLFVSSMGFCLFRNNGPFAFILLLIAVCAIGIRKRGKPFPNFRIICAEMGTALVISLFLLSIALNALNVSPATLIHSLSIPAQQIARVVKNDRALTDEEISILNKALDQSKIADAYTPHSSDPIKILVEEYGGNEAIRENADEFIRLYLTLGIKYPKDYLYAWIDETKGYWNAGYPYWSTQSSVRTNELGIVQTPGSQWMHELAMFADELSGEANKQRVFSLAYCTGFWVQLLICLMVFNALSRKKDYIEAVAILCIVGTLLIATPVFAEFRYIYTLYTCLPFLLYVLTQQDTASPTLPSDELAPS